MTSPDPVLEELRERLGRYPAERYPVQHATTRFHLGVALLERGRAPDAVGELQEAAGLFGERAMPFEHGKASNMLGIALRESGDGPAARQAFEHAAALFSAAGRPVEEAAARYNLGLACSAAGSEDLATEHFSQALELFTRHQAAGQASAAARELAAQWLAQGRPAEAVTLFGRAEVLADEAADNNARGAAANGLGVALLALDRAPDAGEAFRRALAAHPPSVRPAEHAMARANLALACERTGDTDRARLAARQALAIGVIPGPAAEQARALLSRLPPSPSPLAAVLAGEPPDGRSAVLRDEVGRWVLSDGIERRDGVAEWLTVLAGWPLPDELAGQWLGVLLELPPGDLAAITAAALSQLKRRPAAERDRLRAAIDRGMARFPLPQWDRLRYIFAGASVPGRAHGAPHLRRSLRACAPPEPGPD